MSASYMHGGAWLFGSKSFNAGSIIRWKLAQQGFVVVSISYLFAPQHPWPSQLHCLSASLRWILANHASHPAFPKSDSSPSSHHDIPVPSFTSPPLFLLGASAGGHVTLCFALIQALITYGATDCIPRQIKEPVEAALREGAHVKVQ